MDKQTILREFANCLRSEIYAIETYLSVFDKTKDGFVPFRLFQKQKEIIEAFKKHRHNIVAKPRQAGISTTTQAFMAIKATLASRSNPETILVIANKLSLAKKFTKGIKDFIKQLPRWFFGAEFFGNKARDKKDIFETNSQTEMTLAHNGSKIIAVATSGDALRGYSPTYLVFDEAAFIDNGEEVFSAAMSSLSTGGKAVLISCVTKDTFVFTDKGIKEVGDFVDSTKMGGYEVSPYNVLGKDVVRQGNLFKNNGFVKTKKIVTPNSYLEGSYEHKVFAYCDGVYDWVKFKNLTTNHKVSVQYGASLWGNNDNKSLVDKFLNSDLNANDIVIPSQLLELKRDNIISIIRGIFDECGFVRNVKNTIGFKSTSKRFVEQIRIILNNLGILTTYREVGVKNTNYHLELSEVDTNLFYEVIGVIRNKVVIPNNIGNSDIIYNSLNWLRDLKTRLGFTWVELANNLNIKSRFNRDISRENTLKIKKYLLENYSWVKTNTDVLMFDIISENLRWQPITNILEGENETFDFSLPETHDYWCHSVIYNGMLGHQTPNGHDPVYYVTYRGSIQQENTNGFNSIDMRWYQDPRYNKDLIWLDKDGGEQPEEDFTFESYESKLRLGLKPSSSWYRNMCKSLQNNKKKIAQELDVSFVGSGGNVVDDEYIEMQETLNVMEPKWIDKEWWNGDTNLVYIWERPVLEHKYILSADVSSGSGRDFSTFSIIDATTMEQVVEFQGKIPPDKFSKIIYKYGIEYNAYVVVDNINVGASTVLKLMEMEYPNLHYDDYTPKALKRKNLDITSQNNKIAGFNISGVRLQLIHHMEEMIRENIIKIRSKRIINELRTFIYKNNRPDHQDGKNDDCLMALGMGLWILESSFKSLEKVKNTTKAILLSWATNTTPIDSNVLRDSQANIQEKINNGESVPYNQFCAYVSTTSLNRQNGTYNNPNAEYNWLFGKST